MAGENRSYSAERRYEHRQSKTEETIIRPSESFSATPD